VVSWVSGESVGLREQFVGFSPLHWKDQTGKEVAFRRTLSTDHVFSTQMQCESRSVGFRESRRSFVDSGSFAGSLNPVSGLTTP